MAVTNAGELRYRVQLLERIKGLPRKSGFVPSDYRPWANFSQDGEPAKIEEGVGDESGAHGSIDSGSPLLITIRYELPRLPTRDDAVKLLDGSNRICNIISVRDPDQKRRWLELTCRVPA